MKIYIAAWHYRARMVVQRTWGWSPAEELVLLQLDKTPGTIETVGCALNLKSQVVGATFARLMQFGLIELRMSPQPHFSTSVVGRDAVRTGKALPERTADREVTMSLVYERFGGSIFRRRDVKLVQAGALGPDAVGVRFSRNEPDETDESMASRAVRFMTGSLRPGEWLRGARSVNSSVSRRYIEIDLNDVRDGLFPQGSSPDLIRALRATHATGWFPDHSPVQEEPPPPVEIEFDPDSVILGAEEQLDRFVDIVGRAEHDIFVLSTFVASQSDENGRHRRDRLLDALARSMSRGVKCHLFFGSSLDKDAKHAQAMEEIRVRLSGGGSIRGRLAVYREPVRSHVKILAADDGKGGAIALIGSCNWLSTPFNAVELSVELKDPKAATVGLDLLREITAALPEASQSVETLRFMSAEIKRRAEANAARRPRDEHARSARLSVIYAADHEQLLRSAAHEATSRFVCCTNRMGANMVPALFTPAETAGRRLPDVRVLFSRYTGPTKRKHVAEHRKRLHGIVDVMPVKDPQLHCKLLLWDDDHIVISTLNWGSQSGRHDQPYDEIGICLEGSGLATILLGRLERFIGGPVVEGGEA